MSWALLLVAIVRITENFLEMRLSFSVLVTVSPYNCWKLFRRHLYFLNGLPHGSAVKNLPTMQEPQEILVQSLGQEDPLEEGIGNPLQCSCLENPTDRGGWQATVHRVTKSWTWLKWLSTSWHVSWMPFSSWINNLKIDYKTSDLKSTKIIHQYWVTLAK